MKSNLSLIQNVSRLAICGACAVLIYGCGGGSSSGGSAAVVPPPPPPPPTNMSPTASAKVDNSAPQEGQPFELDASDSSDPEGETLTYSWSQTAGPMITLTDTSSEKITLNVPEVAQDETATFQLTVSDGANTATQSIDVVFSNIAQTPVFPVTFGTQIEATFQQPVRGVVDTSIAGGVSFIAFSDTEDSPVKLQEIELNATNDIVLSPTNSLVSSFDQPVIFHTEPLLNVLTTNNGFQEIDVIEETQDKVTIFDVTEAGQSIIDGVYDLESPCAVKRYGFSFDSHSSMLIGQRNLGMSLGEPISSGAPGNPGSSTLFRVTPLITSGESLCVMTTVSLTITGEEFSPLLPLPRGEDIIAIDTDANTINLYELKQDFVSNRKIEYELKESASIELQTEQALELVAYTQIEEGLNGNMGLILAYSDNVHEGTHRLVFVGINGDREIYQETYQWALGVPSDVTFGSVDRSNIPYEVTVVSSTSPQAIVFQGSNTEVITFPRPGVVLPASILPIQGTFFLEVGLGANTIENQAINEFGILITYPDKNQISYFGDGTLTE